MDVTNPGLVNVADQVAGNPSLAADSLAVPRQGDVLEPVADDGYPRGEDVSQALDAASTTFPTPAEVRAGSEPGVPVSQDVGQFPGVAPLFAPTPQINIVDTVARQQVPGVGVTEFVVGPDVNIQTNRNEESERRYVVTSVLDADTGGPVVDPAVPVTGTFNGIFDAGGGALTVLSPTPFPPSVVDGIIVGVVSLPPTYNINAAISNVTSLTGTVSAVSPSTGGKVTVSSPTALPVGLVSGRPATLATGVPAYDGAKVVSGVTGAAGTFAKVATASGGTKILVVSPTIVPAALVPGKFATVAGGVYAGVFKVDSLGTAQGGSYDTAADNGGGGTTFHSTTALPAELAVGQSVTVAGGVYAGTHAVTNVNGGADTFDLAVAFAGTDVGTWVQSGNYAFVLDAAYVSDDSGTWTCHTFDVTAAYSSSPAGTWTSHTFNIPGVYGSTAVGLWTFTPVTGFTTRYRLGVSESVGLGLSPANLTSLGISLLSREIVFDEDTPTVADRGASRLVSYYGAGYVVIERSDPGDDSVPVMAKPTAGPPGDAFTLFVQREGAEVFTDQRGAAVEVVVAPPPPTFVPGTSPSYASQGTVDVATGPQPGAPVPTSGVQVPTARNVSVADQSTVVGLPRNVFV
jgi:hypothetical protein